MPGHFSLRRLLIILGPVLLTAVVLLLALSEYQDRTIVAQREAIEFWQWAGGFPIFRMGQVLEAQDGPCYLILLNDPFPIGSNPRLCLEGDPLPPGAQLRVWIQRNQIHSVEVLSPLVR